MQPESELPSEAVRLLSQLPAEGRVELRPFDDAHALNNNAWIVTVAGIESYALRLADSRSTSDLAIDRSFEVRAARLAADNGFGPPILFGEESTGHLITKLIKGKARWEQNDFKDPANLDRLAGVLNRQHRLTAPPGGLTVFRRIYRLLDRARELDLDLPSTLPRLRERMAEIERESTTQAYGLNHNDLWANNLLDDGTDLWLIDWEFAGPGDGFYDLATVSMAGGFDIEEDHRWLAACNRSGPRAIDRLTAMKWIVHLFEACWSLIMQTRQTDESGGFDYRQHSQRMFDQLG